MASAIWFDSSLNGLIVHLNKKNHILWLSATPSASPALRWDGTTSIVFPIDGKDEVVTEITAYARFHVSIEVSYPIPFLLALLSV